MPGIKGRILGPRGNFNSFLITSSFNAYKKIYWPRVQLQCSGTIQNWGHPSRGGERYFGMGGGQKRFSSHFFPCNVIGLMLNFAKIGGHAAPADSSLPPPVLAECGNYFKTVPSASHLTIFDDRKGCI